MHICGFLCWGEGTCATVVLRYLLLSFRETLFLFVIHCMWAITKYETAKMTSVNALIRKTLLYKVVIYMAACELCPSKMAQPVSVHFPSSRRSLLLPVCWAQLVL